MLRRRNAPSTLLNQHRKFVVQNGGSFTALLFAGGASSAALDLHAACSKSVLPYVATGNNVHTRVVRLQLIYSLKTLVNFRSKVLVDFLHSFTQMNVLTGAIIARHILRRIYLNNNYNYTIIHNSYINIAHFLISSLYQKTWAIMLNPPQRVQRALASLMSSS
jgi:hypothetical protein